MLKKDKPMSLTNTPPAPVDPTAAQRPYVSPALVIHGDVQTLTQISKVGEAPDLDGSGSFTPPDANES